MVIDRNSGVLCVKFEYKVKGKMYQKVKKKNNK